MTFDIKKILIPIAFSENCLKAMEFAEEIAKQFGAEIKLLHVVEASPYEVYQRRGIAENVPLYELAGGAFPSRDQPFIIRDVMEDTKNELEKIAASNKIEGVSYKTEVKHGHSVDEILRTIDEYKPDLVVVATHGRTGLKHMVMGSVAEKIVRLSPTPVLTYRME